MGNPDDAREEYGVHLCEWEQLSGLDALILAVPHRQYMEMPTKSLLGLVRDGGVVVDVKSVLDPAHVDRGLRYWSL